MKTENQQLIMFDKFNEIRDFLEQLGYEFDPDDDIYFDDIEDYLEGYLEEPHKRQVSCSAYLKDQTNENVYYEITWNSDYDLGCDGFVILKHPRKKTVRVVEQVIFTAIKEDQ